MFKRSSTSTRLSRRGSTVVVLVASCLVAGCRNQGAPAKPVVVIYTALDQIYSEPILKRFEERTGVEVRALYDAEAAKTTGLVNRLIARRKLPDCDVFWNNEIIQTVRLAQMGLFEPYQSPQAQRIPAQFRDEHHRWTGFAARLRVLIYNTRLVSNADRPRSVKDLIDPRWRGRTGVARPFFGTTLTHMVWLDQHWGADAFASFCRSLKQNEVALTSGNAAVRDLVAAGELAFGLTDTDDAHGAMLDGKPVAVAIPDRDGGVVLIPNTVALVANCPHPVQGRKLIDFLLSADVERALASTRGAQIPLGTDLADLATPWDELRNAPVLETDLQEAARSVERVIEILRAAGLDR